MNRPALRIILAGQVFCAMMGQDQRLLNLSDLATMDPENVWVKKAFMWADYILEKGLYEDEVVE